MAILTINNNVEFINDKSDFSDLLNRTLGCEAAQAFDEILGEEEYKMEEEIENRMSDMRLEQEELEEEIEKLKEENERLKDELKNVTANIKIEDVFSTSICKVIMEVKKFTKLAKSKKVEEQQNLVVEMLNRIIKM